MKNQITHVLDVIESNRHETGYYKKLKLSLEYGNETQLHDVGDLVKHNHNILPEFYFVAKVIEAYSQNGFWYYVVQNLQCFIVDGDLLTATYKKSQLETIKTRELI